MTLDTSSFPAYVRSLGLRDPVNTRPGRLVPGPPATILEIALRLGLGPLVFDTPRNRALMENIGLSPSLIKVAGQKLRTRSMWLSVMEGLAAPQISKAEASVARGDRDSAIKSIKAALTIFFVALCGDGYYFYTPMAQRGRVLPLTRRLYKLLRAVAGARTQRLRVNYTGGHTVGLLQLPPRRVVGRATLVPALLAFHPLGSDKDSYDALLEHFRAAGLATFCIDLPAHGENFDGERLRPDIELIGAAALEVLANNRAIDASRLGVMGGSLGAYCALRTAAVSPRVKACLAYASPFDLGHHAEAALPGVADCFGWVVGAANPADALSAAREFNLRGILENIECPVCLVHGTQDHLCDFTVSYEIASRLKAPVTVQPLVGADHEVSYPATAELAQPGIEWLKQIF